MELGLCWLAWSLAFLKPRREAAGRAKVVRARKSLWGIALAAVGFSCIWAYVRPAGFEKSRLSLMASECCSGLPRWRSPGRRHGISESSGGTRPRERRPRVDPDGTVRMDAPSDYTSMLGMLLATGAARTWWPMFLAGLFFFLVGTEIPFAPRNVCSPSASRERTTPTAHASALTSRSSADGAAVRPRLPNAYSISARATDDGSASRATSSADRYRPRMRV